MNDKEPAAISPHTQADLSALRAYSRGSERGSLKPLEDRVRLCGPASDARPALEAALAETLHEPVSDVAIEAACGMLARMGSDFSVPALARLLSQERSFEPARAALVAIGTRKAGQTLLDFLKTATGNARLGVIYTLGLMREQRAVRPLTRLARSGDPAVASAAVSALGEIGDVRSDRVLLALDKEVPDLRLADALLVCAENRAKDGDNSSAAKLRQAVSKLQVPAYVQASLERT